MITILFLVSGCQPGAEPDTLSGPIPPEQRPPSSQPPFSAPVNAQITTRVDEPLVIWAPPFFSIDTSSRADAVLAAALAEFAPGATGPPAVLIPKAERGAAGLLAYLLTSKRAAPTLLPDIALINSFDLPRMIEAGIVAPLSSAESALITGLPPTVAASAQVDSALYGFPFVASVEHLVYRKNQIPAPPVAWNDFLALDTQLLFAGGTADDYTLNLLWTLYLAGGGNMDEQGDLTNPQTMASVLALLSEGREKGLIPESIIGVASPQAVWTFFVNGGREMVVVPASLFYNQQAEVADLGFAPLLTVNGQPRGVVTTWSFVIITQDASRRERALQLLQQLFAPHVHGEWSWSAHQLPTQIAALDYWETDAHYTDFLRLLLANSITAPNPRVFDETGRALQQAQRALLTREATPDQVLNTLPFRP
ncbi:MAG: extracellular solute-binding protein [Caldilineaceae bacterium]|nr:extracellular solute-binding protein [Caldilineaceae bacterium]